MIGGSIAIYVAYLKTAVELSCESLIAVDMDECILQCCKR